MHQTQLSAYFGVVNKIKSVQSNEESNIKKHLSDNKQNIVQRKTNCVRKETSRMPDSNSTEATPESRYLPNSMGFSSDEDNFEDKKIRGIPKLCKTSPKKNKTSGKLNKTTLGAKKIRKRKINPLEYTKESSSQNSEFFSTDFVETNKNKINIISDVVLQTNTENNVTPYEMISYASSSKTSHLIAENVENNTIYSQLTQKCPLSSLEDTNSSISNTLKRKSQISESNSNSDNSSIDTFNSQNNSTSKANKCMRTPSKNSSNSIQTNGHSTIKIAKNEIYMRTHSQLTQKCPLSSVEDTNSSISNKLKRKSPIFESNSNSDNSSIDILNSKNNSTSKANKRMRTPSKNSIPQNSSNSIQTNGHSIKEITKLPISQSNSNSDNSSIDILNSQNNSTSKANKRMRTPSKNSIPQNSSNSIQTNGHSIKEITKLPISQSNSNSDNSSIDILNSQNNSTSKANKRMRTPSKNSIPQNSSNSIQTNGHSIKEITKLPISQSNSNSDNSSIDILNSQNNPTPSKNSIPQNASNSIQTNGHSTIKMTKNEIFMQSNTQNRQTGSNEINTQNTSKNRQGKKAEINTLKEIIDTQSTLGIGPNTTQTESISHSNINTKQKDTIEINSTQSTPKKTISLNVTYGENAPPKITIRGNLAAENSGYDIIIQTPKMQQSSEITSNKAQSSPIPEEDEIPTPSNLQKKKNPDVSPITDQSIKAIIANLLKETIENNIDDSIPTLIKKAERSPTKLKRANASIGKSPKKKFQNDSSQMTLTQFVGKRTSKKDDSNSVTKESPTSSNKKAKMDSHNLRCENIQNIINWVFDREYFKILFTKQEEDLLNKLCNISNLQHRIVCVRLFTRLDKWYNLNNLLEELDLDRGNIHLQEMLNVLKADFVDTDYSKEDVMLLLNHLSAADVKDLCSSFKLKLTSNNKKTNNITLLYNHSLHQQTLTTLKTTEQILRDRVFEKLGICVKLNNKFRDILTRVHLLYSFTNSNINTFNDVYLIMNRLKTGETIKHNYKIDSAIVFDDRQQFERYYKSWNLRRQFDDEVEKKNIENQYLLCKQAFTELKELLQDQQLVSSDKYKPLFLRRFSAIWMYCTVISSGSLNLGKHHPHDMCEWLEELLKQQYYCNHKRGLWYIQLSLIKQAHLKDIPNAVEAIIEGLSDKLTTEVHKHELSFRGSRINKKKITQMKYDQLQCLLLPPCDLPEPRIIRAQMVHNNQMGRKLQFVHNTPDGKEYRSVEETAIKHYTTEDNYTDGIHCEGRLLIKLFYIFFWDIIFAQYVPNTFLTEIQHFPLDLSSGEFYANRKKKIDARLKEISELWNLDTLCQFISNTLEKNEKEIASLTNILNVHSRDVTSLHSGDFGNDCSYHIYARCIGKKVLSAIFERFVKNYKQFHSGLPDLFLWNKKELKCCFVEVKSENDTLSITQILWLNYLRSVGANVEVCRVESIGSSSRRGMKKKKDKI